MLTDEKILQLAKIKGDFRVSLRWRDTPLQKQCNALVKSGKLINIGRRKREIVYVPSQK